MNGEDLPDFTGIESELRATMFAHEHQAPTVDQFMARHHLKPRHSRSAPLAIAACVLLTAVVVALISSGRARHHGVAISPIPRASASAVAVLPPLSCPHRVGTSSASIFDGWVPDKPRNVDTANRLVPSSAPDSVVVCAYLRGSSTVTGSTVLGGDLRTVTDDLSTLGAPAPPKNQGCLTYLALTDSDNFLIGLRFGRGIVWVSVPGNHCRGSTNGSDNSQTNLRADAQQAYRTSVWNTDPIATARCAGASTQGTSGPAITTSGSTSLTICARTRGPLLRAYRYVANYGDLPDIIRPYANQVAPAGCTLTAASGGALLILDYPNRHDVVLAVTPECSNGVKVRPRASYELLGEILEFEIGRL